MGTLCNKMKKLGGIILLLSILFTANKKAQAEKETQYAAPGINSKSMTTPVAWAVKPGTIFGYVGGTNPAPYTIRYDGAAVVGFGIGEPKKYVGIQCGLVFLDLSGLARYALKMKISHHLSQSNAIAFGIENIVLQDSASPSDGRESYYVVYSKGIQNNFFINKKNKKTELHYSVGIGTGRFRETSDYDIDAKKGRFGTAIFGNISYDMLGLMSVICDWNGVNLNAGLSKTIKLNKNVQFGLNIGYSDLTMNSGNGKRMIGGVGGSLTF